MSVASETVPLTLDDLVLVDQGVEPYVLSWPDGEVDGQKESLVLALLRREDGVLLVVPDGFLPPSDLILANEGMDSGIIGPSKYFEVQSAVLDGGRLNPTGSVVSCQVVDFQAAVVNLMRAPVAFEDILFSFDKDSLFAVPDPAELLPQVLDWIQASEVGSGLAFYSATGGETPDQANGAPGVPKRPKAKAGTGTPSGKAKEKPKKATTASLSASIENLLTVIPGLSSQMQTLTDRQKVLEDRVLAASSASFPALRQPLSNAMPGQSLAPSAVVAQIHTPPRTNLTKGPGLLRSPALAQPEDLLELEKEKPLSAGLGQNDTLAQAVLAQSHALNNLVAQIAQSSSDPLVDLGGVTSGGTRGSVGRAKLQAELASQKGLFFQAVLQSMARRMSPTVSVEGSPQQLMDRGICGTRYLERFGGYAKHRDLGMLQYQVMSVMDFLQTENLPAARDAVALLSVTLEQAVLDGGRFDLAGVLCLQDDLPSSIFVNRQAGALSRSRSFAPLADQRWITTALAYLKELDAIQVKRGELSGQKTTAAESDRPKPKATPKKRGAKGGKGDQRGVCWCQWPWSFKAEGSSARVEHILVFILDFLFLGRFPTLAEIGRPANEAQLAVFKRLRSALAVCGASTERFPLVPGRSGPELASCLMQLEHFVDFCPAFVDVYSKVPQKSFTPDPGLLPPEKYPQLVPHRDLDASRLKLVGEGKWPMEKFLRNKLWLPFQEPAFLSHGGSVEGASVPTFRFESKEECLKLAKLWDVKGVLSLFASPVKPNYFCRVFQVYKSAEHDRQIGDRRLPNASEYHIDGPSRHLPPGQLLCQMHVPRKTHQAFGSITDRRDFYHQAAISLERAQTNMLPFSYPLEAFHGCKAFDEWNERVAASRAKRDRITEGDRFGLVSAKKGLLVDGLFPAFRSLFQGDHLGVEFALASHEQLLCDEGLLDPSRRLLGHFPVPDSHELEGLIIDDYFAISVEPRKTPASVSFAALALARAREAYQKHELIGSVEKDVCFESKFKAAGAEIDSSQKALAHDMVTVAAPWEKRFGLSVLSLRAARLPWISKQLAVRLSGNWVSVLLYRRCLSSLVDDFFALGASCENDPVRDNNLVPLPRKCAQELAMLAACVPLVFTNVSVNYDERLFASDSSSRTGAYTETLLGGDLSKLLWRHADKKGTYSKLESPVRAILKELLPETELVEENLLPGPFKAPLLKFDFVEFYGGAGVISKEMSELGFVVAPVLDLSLSPHYDMSDLRLLEWAVHMIEDGLFRSFMLEPPCTSFSPAAHPSVRSYAEPLGYDRTEKKTLHGNQLAFRSFVLLKVGHRHKRPCGLEQPRLSKMAWLVFWRTLLELGFREAIIAACQFGSIHRKEFRFLLHLVNAAALEKRCPGGHPHVRIEGKWTKGSAVYPQALGKHIALGFARALRLDVMAPDEPVVEGFESLLVNDIMDSNAWTLGSVWDWKKKSHINVYETDASVAAMLKASVSRPHSRACFVVDSLVAKGALSKGRSSSRKLQPSLKRSCAIQIACDCYPAWCYSPTRLNVPDDPTRDAALRKPVDASLRRNLKNHELELLHANGFRRFAANWFRLVILLVSAGSQCEAVKTGVSLRDGYEFGLANLGFLKSVDFWTFLSCPFPFIWISSLTHFLGIVFLVCVLSGFWKVVGRCPIGSPRGLRILVLVSQLGSSFAAMGPVTAEESRRAAQRGNIFLPADRVMRGQTRNARKVLVGRFRSWLWKEHSVSLFGLLQQKPPDPEQISHWLAEYGRDMYRAGKSYGQYSETINGIAMMKPIIKRQLISAWDVAFAWLVDEPHQHHPALPLSALLAMLTVSLAWGWPYEAAVISLAWAGLLRIGEVLQSQRSDLILPEDSAPGTSFALLKIKEPKTRGRHARHQAARVDQSDVISLLAAVYGPLAPHEALWPYSAATLRKRFASLLLAVGLPTEKKAGVAPFSLGSLRPGGATFLLHACENSELVRRRGRWLSTRVMEVYLQEILVATFVKKLDPTVRARLESLALGFAGILRIAIGYLNSGIPPKTWWWLLRGEAGFQGDAGTKWQKFHEDCPDEGTAWHHRNPGLAEKGSVLDFKHITELLAAAQGPSRPAHCSHGAAGSASF
eukprot:s1573_g10.t1